VLGVESGGSGYWDPVMVVDEFRMDDGKHRGASMDGQLWCGITMCVVRMVGVVHD